MAWGVIRKPFLIKTGSQGIDTDVNALTLLVVELFCGDILKISDAFFPSP